MRRSRLLFLAAALIGAAALVYVLVSALRPGEAARSASAAPAAPPPSVGVVTLKTADVPLTLVYAGRVASYRAVEIRSQVSGLLLKREFREGDKVAAKQVLFRIDPEMYRAALDRANATLAQGQATLRQTEENLGRAQELAQRGAGTQKALDEARAARDQARAAVQLAEADVRTAQLNLNYTTITAPVAGLTGLVTPPEGTLVQAQQTVLTTITQLDPAYVNYSISDAEYQQFRAMNHQRAKPIDPNALTVKLQLGDGTIYEHSGRFEVSSNTINLQTGTLQLRAIFPNPDGAILPGQFVRVIITGVDLPNALVLPKEAVSQGPQGPFVYRVEANDIAKAQPIQLGRDLDTGWVVREGLAPGDRVVVDGVVRVKPGAPVRPTEMTAGDKPREQRDGRG